MDTHGQDNKAGPKREFSSVFRGGPISQGETQADGLKQNGQSSNPYRFAQTSREDNTKEQSNVAVSVQEGSLLKKIKNKLLPEKPGVNNTRQKVMVILIPVLFIVMIFMFRQVLSKSPRETEGAVKEKPVVTKVNSGNEIDWQIPEPISTEIRDPIKPAPRTTVTNVWQADSNNIGMLNVRGIIYSQDKPSAVINNRIVHLNDTIDGATVVEIDSDYVIFEKDGKRWTKKVAEPEMGQQQPEQQEQQQTESVTKTGEIQS